jgi:hypothetical protein
MPPALLGAFARLDVGVHVDSFEQRWSP